MKRSIALAVTLAVPLLLAARQQASQGQGQEQASSDVTAQRVSPVTLKMAEAIRKALVTLPDFSVFDDLHFAIEGKTVILHGDASRPTLKSSAERVVKKVEGVETVRNEIEVLPLSPNDDRIRAAVYYRLYSQPSLQKYTNNRGPQFTSMVRRNFGISQDPPIGWHAIHIIVKNGQVTLKGVVLNSGDATIAGMQANSTPGVFRVDNELMVASEEK